MQFVSFPIPTLVRPTVCPISLPQMMSFALTADFKKYALAYVLNDLPSSEKDQKKSETAETSISTSSFEEIIQGKVEEKPVEASEKNRKAQDSIQIQDKTEENLTERLPKKRQCYERARCQITQAFESSQQSKEEEEGESSEKEEELITYKNRIESKSEQIKQNVNLVRKQKKIQKAKKVFKIITPIEPQQKLFISTTVSLIDTIDQPRISIDLFEIQRKRQNLLSRAVVYDEFQQKKCVYGIRERRELKRLN